MQVKHTMVISFCIMDSKSTSYTKLTWASDCCISRSSRSKHRTAYTSFSRFSIFSRNFNMTSEKDPAWIISEAAYLMSTLAFSISFRVSSLYNNLPVALFFISVHTLRENSGFHWCFGRLHNLLKHLPLFLTHEWNWATSPTCSCCSTHSMNIVFGGVGHGKIDYLLNKVLVENLHWRTC